VNPSPPASTSPPRNGRFALLAAALLLPLAAFELGRVVLNRPWGVFPPLPSHAVSVLLAVLWSTGAVAMLLRDRARLVAKLAFVAGVLSPIAMLVHGLVTGGVLERWGLLYVPLAAALAVIVKQVFGDGELQRLRLRHHLDEDAGLEASVRYAAGSQRPTP
jgi:hypothetical protein